MVYKPVTFSNHSGCRQLLFIGLISYIAIQTLALVVALLKATLSVMHPIRIVEFFFTIVAHKLRTSRAKCVVTLVRLWQVKHLSCIDLNYCLFFFLCQYLE